MESSAEAGIAPLPTPARARTSTPSSVPRSSSSSRRHRRVVVVFLRARRARRASSRAPRPSPPAPSSSLSRASHRLAASTHSSPFALARPPLPLAESARSRRSDSNPKFKQTTLMIPPSRTRSTSVFASRVRDRFERCSAARRLPRTRASTASSRESARSSRAARECAVRIIRVDRACPNRLGVCAMCGHARYTRQMAYSDCA